VLLVGMPHMLRDILAGVVAAQPDMEVAGEWAAVDDLEDAARHAEADVVLAGLSNDQELPSEYHELVNRLPRVKVLGISASGRRAVLYGLFPQTADLGEVSPETLASTIRRAAGSQAR